MTNRTETSEQGLERFKSELRQAGIYGGDAYLQMGYFLYYQAESRAMSERARNVATRLQQAGVIGTAEIFYPAGT